MTHIDFANVPWRKSNRSQPDNNCVEAGPAWRKSSRSAPDNACVELADHSPHVAVRDSKNPAQHPLAFERPTWSAFASRLKTGRYDLG